MVVKFYLGNPKTIEEITQKTFAFGKFLFRKDNNRFGLYLGEYNSHPAMVEGLKLLKEGESEHEHIWGGGEIEVDRLTLKFSGSSSTYGKVPNSFLIDCCKHVKIPNIGRFVFALLPYYTDDPSLEARRKTWREIGGYKLDTERKEYVFERVCNRLVRRE